MWVNGQIINVGLLRRVGVPGNVEILLDTPLRNCADNVLII